MANNRVATLFLGLVVLVGWGCFALTHGAAAAPPTQYDYGNASWSTKGKTPAIILQPVNTGPIATAAVQEAADRWNVTGYARFVVMPAGTDPNFTPPPSGYLFVVHVINDPQVCCFTSMDIQNGTIKAANVHLNLDETSQTMQSSITHELGHVLLGNQHHNVADGLSILGLPMTNPDGSQTWVNGFCPGPLDLEVMATHYPKDKGAMPAIPAGGYYDRNAVVDCGAQ